MVREGRVFISPTAGKPQYGIGYYVTAYEVGAQVAAASSGTTVTVRAGHGFAAGDKYMNGTDTGTFSGTLTVQSVKATTLVLSSAYAVAEGDLLVNLAADTGTAAPNYDGAGLTIYTDMAFQNVATDNTVLTDSFGRYIYYHLGSSRWELVRGSTGSPVAIYSDTGPSSPNALLDVKAYGAVGDGLVDDGPSIQAALDSVGVIGADVYVPSGTYATAQQLYIKSNTVLRGAGRGVSIIKRRDGSVADSTTIGTAAVLVCGPSQGTMYSTSSSGTNIGLESLTLDGNVSAFSTQVVEVSAFCFRAEGVDGLSINNCEMSNSLQDGVYMRDCRNVTISNNYIHNVGQLATPCARNGITFVNYSGGSSWGTNCTITGNVIKGAHDEGVSVFNSSHVSISGNDISGGLACIEITGDNTVSSTECVSVTGNTFHDGVSVDSPYVGMTFGVVAAPPAGQPIRGLSVTGNSITNFTVNAIYVNNAPGVVVSGNSVYNCSTFYNSIYFNTIDVLNSSDSVISSNTIIYGTCAAGIYGIRAYSLTNAIVSNNVVVSPTAACIILNVSTQDSMVIGNRLVGGTYGVQIAAFGTNSGNTVFQNVSSGASVAGYIDSSGQTNYVNQTKVGSGSDSTVVTTLTFDGATNDGTMAYNGSNKFLQHDDIVHYIRAADFVNAIILAGTTASSTRSPFLKFIDNQGTPAQLYLSKDGAYLALTNNAGAIVSKLGDDGSFLIKDGITAPSTAAGYATIYVDTADGYLKVKFGDGTVKTIVVDT